MARLTIQTLVLIASLALVKCSAKAGQPDARLAGFLSEYIGTRLVAANMPTNDLSNLCGASPNLPGGCTVTCSDDVSSALVRCENKVPDTDQVPDGDGNRLANSSGLHAAYACGIYQGLQAHQPNTFLFTIDDITGQINLRYDFDGALWITALLPDYGANIAVKGVATATINNASVTYTCEDGVTTYEAAPDGLRSNLVPIDCSGDMLALLIDPPC